MAKRAGMLEQNNPDKSEERQSSIWEVEVLLYNG